MGLHELEDEVMMSCPHCGGDIDYNNEAVGKNPYARLLAAVKHILKVGGGTGVGKARLRLRREYDKVK